MSGGDLPMEAYLAALAGLPKVGPAGLRRMLRSGPPAVVWERVATGRLAPADLPTRAADPDLLRAAASASSPAEVWERCRRHDVAAVALGSPGYPEALASDPDPPAVVFLRGDTAVLRTATVAVVGTRRATGYGRRVAHELGAGLAAAGVSVVSGLALGIDAAAHAGALEPGGDAPAERDDVHGATAGPVGVVAAGLDRPAPHRNAGLAREVARRGLLVSELPPGCRPEPWRFPVRNRLLVALADAVVVVESGRGGGSMSTVGHALDRDRPLLAVPGPVDSPVSEGPNALLSDGALVCTGLADVLLAIGRTLPPAAGARPSADGPPGPDADGACLLEHLGWQPVTTGSLVERSGLSLAVAVPALGRLEDQGWVRRHGGLVERIGGPR
ncbi:MAG: DNA-processing protein DprA [Microthrixaceae bacterium]